MGSSSTPARLAGRRLLAASTALSTALGLMSGGASAQSLKEAVPLPVAPPMQTGRTTSIDYRDLMRVGALPSYAEPAWVADLVKAGKLPALKDRLPPEPVVVDVTKSAPDGVGQYGGVLRHVSGSRPQGWNWMAGNIMAWGGVEEIIDQCLVRNAPLWMLTKERVEPLPQLATSWDWSADGHGLTMHLLKGAKWSDGQPFGADDVMFMWDDNISDPKVPAWVRQGTYGEGTTLKKVDDATVVWTFKDAFPIATLYQMGWQKLCPGPAHILKPLHPRYNPQATYDSYIGALKPDRTPWVSMGPWTVTQYKPDQVMVMRRNPYFWEVDEKGNQLPYLDEVQYKLSTWGDRTVQTVSGSADYANMEDPSIFLESLRRAKDPAFPVQIIWGPRSYDYSLYLNMADTCGAGDPRDKALRALFRDLAFRRAVTQGIDRQAIGQSLVKGPFISPYPGGIHPESQFADPKSIVYYPYDLAGSRAALAGLGFRDTDGDGVLNWPAGSEMAGRNLDVYLTHTTEYTTDVTIAQTLVTMFRELGINLVLRPTTEDLSHVLPQCQWDMAVSRGTREWTAPIMELGKIAPLDWSGPSWHVGTSQAPQNLLAPEKEMLGLIEKIRTERDTDRRNDLFHQFDHVFTQNVETVGLFQYAAAMLVNKRFKNVPSGAPIYGYGWGEDGIMRERLWVAPDEQGKVPELGAGTLPGVQ